MSKRNTQTRLWKNIASVLDEMDDQSLRGLVHDLFKLSPENRAYLAAWIGDEDATVELLDGYKARITSQFYGRTKPRLGGGCDLALCKRLIKEYRRLTTASEMVGGFDVHGTIDLSLHFIEVGTRYVNDIGWNEAKPYDYLGEVAHDLSDLIESKIGQRYARPFLARVRAVASAAHGIGYGYGDALTDLADSFEESAALFQARRSIK
ncbi:MAG: hypothetical protein EA377_14240 [Phycisphaerales bacterium]|nr:MAG: hypothetical protein EA377_14240 [Phycisphaerales bacterium]